MSIYFYTATILHWQHLLKPDKYKDIIIDALKFIVKNKRAKIFAFVIMPNHIHIVWKINDDFKYSDIRRDFMKYTAQVIKEDLIKNHPKILKKFFTGAKDRSYQIWERDSLSIELVSQSVFEQKINYIHKNPLTEKWSLADEPQDYKYSSAKFYYHRIDEFGILENYFSI